MKLKYILYFCQNETCENSVDFPTLYSDKLAEQFIKVLFARVQFIACGWQPVQYNTRLK